MKKIRFGLVGCGRISKKHFEAITANADAVLGAICDLDAKKLESTNSLYPADNVYKNYQELLNDPTIDVINICTPSGRHAEMAIEALNHGKHVILEKPMAMNCDEAKRIIEARDKNKKAALIVLQNRCNSPVCFLKDNQDKLGKILGINASVFWYRPQEYYNDGWHGTKKMDGGVLMNQGTHYLDLITYFMQEEPIDIIAAGSTLGHEMECEDAASLILKFSEGRICTLQANTISYPENFEGSIILFFEKATVKISGKALNEIGYWRGELEESIGQCSQDQFVDIYGSSHKVIINNMVNHLLRGEKLITPIEEGVISLKIIEQAYKIMGIFK